MLMSFLSHTQAKLVLTIDTLARTDLEFPLGGHDLCIDAGDVDASIQTGLVVRFYDISAVDFSSPNRTVVRALRTWVTTLRPAIRPAIRTEQGVFLFKTEPCVLVGVGVHQPCGVVSVVELVWASVMVPGLAQNEDVVATTEGIGIYGDRSYVDIGIIPWGLTGRRAVKVPFREFFVALDRA